MTMIFNIQSYTLLHFSFRQKIYGLFLVLFIFADGFSCSRTYKRDLVSEFRIQVRVTTPSQWFSKNYAPAA
jgi:hypothetical protein